MKIVIILTFLFLALASTIPEDASACINKSKQFFTQAKTALTQNNMDSIIDSI